MIEPMRVCDLIEELKKFPPFMEVEVDGRKIIKVEKSLFDSGADLTIQLRSA